MTLRKNKVWLKGLEMKEEFISLWKGQLQYEQVIGGQDVVQAITLERQSLDNRIPKEDKIKFTWTISARANYQIQKESSVIKDLK